MPKIVAQKEDWIKLGYQLFSEKGIDGIVIEKMSTKLKCNKSSFYWHFKTKKAFIDTLVAYWVESDTEQTIKFTNQKTTATQKMDTLLKIVYKQQANLDFIFYLKKYAQKQNKILKLIDGIDNQRIIYVTKLLTELNYSEKESKIKASLFYKHLIGYHEMIRYKKQNKNYLQEVKEELSQFINFENEK